MDNSTKSRCEVATAPDSELGFRVRLLCPAARDNDPPSLTISEWTAAAREKIASGVRARANSPPSQRSK
eukprot:3788116-Pyramimonas_sp.AAC.1